MLAARTSPHIDGSAGTFKRGPALTQRDTWLCRFLASATPAAAEPYIAQQPRTPSHERRFGPSTLICRGKVDALGQRCAAADKRSPKVDGLLWVVNERRSDHPGQQQCGSQQPLSAALQSLGGCCVIATWRSSAPDDPRNNCQM